MNTETLTVIDNTHDCVLTSEILAGFVNKSKQSVFGIIWQSFKNNEMGIQNQPPPQPQNAKI